MEELVKQKKEEKIITYKILFIYLVFILAVLTSDVVFFLHSLTKLNFNLSFILLTLVFFIGYFITLKNFFCFEKLKLNKINICCILFVGLITIVSIPFPDAFYDTLYYHIFLQSPDFLQGFNQNFFPGGLGTYLFPLPDRMFYIFNHILGYRLGTILNPLVIIIIYFQSINIIETYFKINNIEINKRVLAILGLIVISTEYIVLNFTIYATDLLALPILIEILRLAIFKEKYNKAISYYVSLLFGITVALKLSFIVFLIPILLLYLINYRKEIKLLEYILCPILAAIPASIYLLYSYMNTGNPVFPMYNEIFKSLYFPPVNMKQTVFGPQNFLEYLIWPVYILFHPSRLVELSVYAGRLTIGYIIAIWSIIYIGINRRSFRFKTYYILIALFFIQTLLWEYTSGYARYGLFLEVFSGIIIIILAMHYMVSESKSTKALGYIILVSLLVQVAVSYCFVLIKNVNWASKPSILNANRAYIDNLKLLGRDRVNPADYKILQNVETWVITNYNSAYAVLLKKNIPIIHLKLWWVNDETPPKAVKELNALFNKFKQKKMYTIATYDQFPDTIKTLQKYGLSIVSTKGINPPFLQSKAGLLLIEIRRGSNEKAMEMKNGNSILDDYSFESLGKGDTSKWNLLDTVNQVIMDSKAQQGNYYVKAAVDKPITQVVTVNPGKMYKLSFFSKYCEENKKSTRMQINWQKGAEFLACSISVVESTKNWEKHEMQVVAPESADTAIIYVNSHEKYFVDFDNVTFSEVY